MMEIKFFNFTLNTYKINLAKTAKSIYLSLWTFICQDKMAWKLQFKSEI